MGDCEARQLASRIREAFRDVTRGNGVTLREARAMDDYESREAQLAARELDTDQHWQELNQCEIEELYDAFTFLDAEGMRYYLAPFLVYDLEHPDGDWPVTEWAVARLADPDCIPWFALFNEAQSVAIACCLRFLANHWDEVYSEIAATALRIHWNQFLPDNI